MKMRAAILLMLAVGVLTACGEASSGLFAGSSTSAEGILRKGGGLTVSASQFSSTSLEGMASAAAEGGAELHIRDSSDLSSTSMEGIAAKAPGQVSFE